MKSPVYSGVCKVPMVMQMEALECGAACLTMVLAYYRKWIPLEQVRTDCGVSKNGSKAGNILRAARAYGLTAYGYKFEPERLKEKGTFPCIIHWCFNHFVVLCGFRGNKAYLNDPARGTYAVSMEEFDESFTGICLMFEPGEEFEMSGRPQSMLQFARKRLTGSGSAVAFVVLSSVIASLLGLAEPVFSRVFADSLLSGDNPEWTVPFLIILSAFSLVTLTVAWIHAIYSLKISGKLAAVGNTGFMWKVLHMPMTFFSQRSAGDIITRKEANASIAINLVDVVAPLAINSAMAVFYFAVMLRYSWILTLIGFSSVLINAGLSLYISNKHINITRVRMRDEGKLAGTTVAGIEMIETIKASGSENGFFERWSGFQAAVNAQDSKYQRIDAFLGIIPEFVASLADIVILCVGMYLTFSGHFTVGMIMAFQGFFSSFSEPASELLDAAQTMQEMRADMERIEDVMSYPDDVVYDYEFPEEDTEYSKIPGNIELKNVTFGYSSLEEPLIRNFSLSVKQGQRIALVGMSGCGKSTISKLISGLYQPWEGEILYDGRPLSEIDRNVFTGSVAVVDQDIILYEDTIENNIKLWDSSIEDFEMILAARDAQIHEDIMLREGGYKYRINEGGRDFSGGQCQRLEIARVLAQDPNVIILDEATSALDARTEYNVVNAIKDRGITCIIVAHRLSTIRDCDEIIVLDHGEVIERGTHDELMKSGGAYVSLVTNN